MKRSRKSFLIAVALFLMIGIIALVVAIQVTGQRRNAAVAAIKNLRVIEKYAERVAKSPESIASFERAVERVKVLDDSEVWWKFVSDLAGGHDLFSGSQLLTISPLKPSREWTMDDWALASDATQGTRDLVLEIRCLAATGGPATKLDLSRYDYEQPDLMYFLEMARVLAANAIIQSHQGQPEETAEDLVALMQLSGVLAKEPSLSSQYIRGMIVGIAFGTASDALPIQGLPPCAAEEIMAEAAQSAHREFYAASFAGEGHRGMNAFEIVRAGTYDMPGGLSSRDLLARLAIRAYGSFPARPWLNLDEEMYASSIGQLYRAVQLPFWRANTIFEHVEGQINKEVSATPRTRLLAPMFLCRPIEPPRRQGKIEVMLDLMRIGVAIEQYRVQNGRFPPTLDPVALGGQVPADPFTGAAYQYKPAGSTFQLYSVGLNQIDDNGQFSRERRLDDIVWRDETRE